MGKAIVVMRGPGQLDMTVLNDVAGDFHWIVHVARDLHQAAELVAQFSTVAVLATHHAVGLEFSWLEIIRLLRGTLPDARLVVCHGFGEVFDWTQLCNAGAFHALQLPLQERELRQSLGFIWEAEKRRTAPRPVRKIAAA